MNLNPYEKTGKHILYIGWGLMALAFVMGASIPPWSIVLNLGLLGFMIYKGKL